MARGPKRRADAAHAAVRLPTNAEIHRVIKAVQDRGLTVTGVEVGAVRKIMIRTATMGESSADAALDAWQRRRSNAA